MHLIVVQGTEQKTNTRGKAKMPDHYRCTMASAFCGRPKHHEDECYYKKRLAANLKSANSPNWGQNSKGNSHKGKGKSKGGGKGQDQCKGGRGGPDKRNEKNQEDPWGNPSPTPSGTSPDTSGGQQKTGPTICSPAHPQAQKEQGAKRSKKDGDEHGPRKWSRLMRMVRKLCKKGFDITLIAEFSQGRSGGIQLWFSWYVSVYSSNGILRNTASPYHPVIP